ncbi:MAG: hypothetical protein JWM28_1986 [Chitinophagaceae bacterium]|nr:hypothetical protein [Chitinophagaceae bacterium]
MFIIRPARLPEIQIQQRSFQYKKGNTKAHTQEEKIHSHHCESLVSLSPWFKIEKRETERT